MSETILGFANIATIANVVVTHPIHPREGERKGIFYFFMNANFFSDFSISDIFYFSNIIIFANFVVTRPHSSQVVNG
jgi:hypothetical protein